MAKEFAPCEVLENANNAAERIARLMKHPRIAYLLFRYLLAPLWIDRETARNRTKRVSFLKMGGGSIPQEIFPAISAVIYTVVNYNKKALSASKKGEPLVWFTWSVPAVVLRVFDVPGFCPENFYTTANSLGSHGSGHFCELAEAEGVSADMCSVNRSMLGAFFSRQLPKPTHCISASLPCDGNHSGNIILKQLIDVPQLTLSGSYSRSSESIKHWAKSIMEMIPFLERQFNRPFDWDLLAKFGENINRANRALNAVTDMHRNLPSPNIVPSLTLFWRTSASEAGTEEFAAAAEELLAGARSIQERIEREKRPREKIRVVIGDQGISWTDLSYWMNREFGAVIVSDYIGRFCHPEIDVSSRESLIEGVARDRLMFSMTRQSHGTAEHHVEELETVIQEYSPDCVLFNGHTGCKHNLALQRELEAVCQSSGLPCLFIGADIADSRQMNEGEVRAKVTQFFKTSGLIK